MRKKTAKKKLQNNGRAKGQTQISVSLPTELLKRIDKVASKQIRNRSNLIVSILNDAV